jgi:hypothetical protein
MYAEECPGQQEINNGISVASNEDVHTKFHESSSIG